jgi:hypothetical protein
MVTEGFASRNIKENGLPPGAPQATAAGCEIDRLTGDANFRKPH